MNATQPIHSEQPITKLQAWFYAARPKTLAAGIAPVILGSALASQLDSFNAAGAFLCLLFSLLVQIGCNYANDYYDYIKGVDTQERIGFKRAVASGWIEPQSMFIGMWVTLALAFIVACTLVVFSGWPILALGILSIICAIAYTAGPFPLGYYGLGDLFVFLFFGLVAVMCTTYVQAGFITVETFWAASACGLLAANIRLVNDTRDIETDTKAGKKTMPVRLGKTYAHVQYMTCTLLALVIPVIMKVMSMRAWVLLPFLLSPWALHLNIQFMQAQSGEDFNTHLSKTAQFLLAYCALLGLGISLS